MMADLKKRKINKKIISVLIVFSFIGLTAIVMISNTILADTYYTLYSPKIDKHFRIVQLTDIHGKTFGNDNSLIDNVKNQQPDLILITGDIINYKSSTLDEELEQMDILIRQLRSIAPTYISYGNHEDAYDEIHGGYIAERYENDGAIVLREQYQDIEVNGQTIRVGGTYGYCAPEMYHYDINQDEFLKDFENTDLYKVLMCHIPLCWIENNSLYDWDVDCVFSGHIHGGQIQIPFVGGLYAPDQGWFPGKVDGLYQTTKEGWDDYLNIIDDWAKKQKKKGNDVDVSRFHRDYSESVMVLSRGLGNSELIPRINNRPEIVVVDFKPKNDIDSKEMK